MNPLETTKQALAILLRGYSGADWEGLAETDRSKLAARAKTLIALGHGMLQKLEAPANFSSNKEPCGRVI